MMSSFLQEGTLIEVGIKGESSQQKGKNSVTPVHSCKLGCKLSETQMVPLAANIWKVRRQAKNDQSEKEKLLRAMNQLS